ncbi:MAG: hypothetical protein DBX46_00045 [Clostridiales bacterium]|nr:MAG: hypothetical protein DBX46_00045 [Clostridiales bacterium]
MVAAACPAAAAAPDNYDEAVEEALQNGVKDTIDGTDLSSMEEIFDQYGNVFDGSSMEDAVEDIAANGFDLSEEEALEALKALLFEAFLSGLPNLIQIVVVLLLLGLLSHWKNTGSVAASSFTAGYIVMACIAIAMLTSTVTVVKDAIDTLGTIVDVTTPVLIGLLTSIGGFSSSALLSPAMAALTGGVFTAVRVAILPAILIALVLAVASNISSMIKLQKTSSLIYSFVKWALTLIMIVFLGVMAIKGLSGAAIDGITFKTAKYTIDKMVPVIGGMFSDSLDTLMACGLMVKNGVGIVGVVIMGCAMAAPIAAVVGNMFLFKLAAAVSEPFADERCTAMFTGIAGAVQLMAVVLLLCCAMAFISVAVFIGAANTAIMLR